MILVIDSGCKDYGVTDKEYGNIVLMTVCSNIYLILDGSLKLDSLDEIIDERLIIISPIQGEIIIYVCELYVVE